MTVNGHSTSPKVAIVTGASSGIGQACAIKLGQNGWTVTLVGRRKEMLHKTASQISRYHICAGDLTEPAFVTQVFQETVERFGRLDLLFNNAGCGNPDALLEDLTLKDFMSVLNVNLIAPFLCTQEAFKIFKVQNPQGGRIINNGSISAYVPRPNSVAYTTTKHAITGLTKSSALDGRKYHIAVSQLDIGNATTELSAHAGAGSVQADGSTKQEAMMEVKYVADTLLFMASLPLGVNIQNQTILATDMPSWIGRG